jgi:hypothetical protein
MSEQNRMLEQFLDTSYASQDSVADVKLGATENGVFLESLKSTLGPARNATERLPGSEKKKPRLKQPKSLLQFKFSAAETNQLRRQASVQSLEEISQANGSQVKRRLSEMSFGKLMPNDYSGLKLQWNVQNDAPKDGWL